MSSQTSFPDTASPAEAGKLPDALSDGINMRRDAVDSRARLCFRSLALGLAAVVTLLISVSLYAVTLALVEALRVKTPAAFGAFPADLAFIAADAAGALLADGGPQALVAVISVLLIGDVVLAIGLVRATFSMRVNTDAPAPLAKDQAVVAAALPGVELLKAFADALATVTKGLHGR